MVAGFRAEAPGLARVLVKRRDLAAARGVLADLRAESVDLDWSQVDVGTRADLRESEERVRRDADAHASAHASARAAPGAEPDAEPGAEPEFANAPAQTPRPAWIDAVGVAALLAGVALVLSASARAQSSVLILLVVVSIVLAAVWLAASRRHGFADHADLDLTETPRSSRRAPGDDPGRDHGRDIAGRIGPSPRDN
jgi:hypothetical protein